MSEPANRIQAYYAKGFNEVEGWCSPLIIQIVGYLAELQKTWGIEGCACEIGVFQGKFFLGLACAVQGRPAVAIDLFDNQQLNIDNSGGGTPNLLQRFRENINAYAPKPEDVVEISTDSLDFTLEQQLEFLRLHGKVQLFSIDGGHTPEHVVNDYRIAEFLTLGGGFIIIDDIMNSGWPGVFEGVSRLFLQGRPRFVPLLIGHNKLFLVGFSYHQRFLQQLTTDFSTVFPNAPVWRVKLFGYDLLALV